MDVGGNGGGGQPVNNKQRAMLPNKSRGEFTRNQRKDSEVRGLKNVTVYFLHAATKRRDSICSCNIDS